MADTPARRPPLVRGVPEWGRVALWGLFFVAASNFFYWYFDDAESSTDPRQSMNWVLGTIYDIGGTFLLSGWCLAVAGVFFVWAYRRYQARSVEAPPAP